MSKVSRNKYAIDCTILSNFICSTLLTLVNFLYLLLYLYIEEGKLLFVCVHVHLRVVDRQAKK